MRCAHWLPGALFFAVGLASLATVSAAETGVALTAAATSFLKSLSAEQRAQALLDYQSPDRTDWGYTATHIRKGLPLAAMDASQRELALALLAASLSDAGRRKALAIMRLDAAGSDAKRPRAAGDRYYVALFGTPDPEARWGLRIEGPQLSLNFVIDKQRVISSTPTCFGANPSIVKTPAVPELPVGSCVLAQEEALAFQLLESLSAPQRQAAVVSKRAPADIRNAGLASPPISVPTGLAANDMTPEQVALLQRLVREYAENLPSDLAQERLALIEEQHWGNVRFDWLGAETTEAAHHYRIQGMSFVIELSNTRSEAAGQTSPRIHTVWHHRPGNFALPVEFPR